MDWNDRRTAAFPVLFLLFLQGALFSLGFYRFPCFFPGITGTAAIRAGAPTLARLVFRPCDARRVRSARSSCALAAGRAGRELSRLGQFWDRKSKRKSLRCDDFRTLSRCPAVPRFTAVAREMTETRACGGGAKTWVR